MVAMVGVGTSIGYLFPLLPFTNARARHPKTTFCFLAVSFDLAVGCVICLLSHRETWLSPSIATCRNSVLVGRFPYAVITIPPSRPFLQDTPSLLPYLGVHTPHGHLSICRDIAHMK